MWSSTHDMTDNIMSAYKLANGEFNDGEGAFEGGPSVTDLFKDPRLDEELKQEFKDYKDLDASKYAEQAAFVREMTGNPRGMHVLSGEPGTGKSFVIRHLTHLFRNQGKSVSLFAYTGVAAERLGSKSAKTMHAGMAINANHVFYHLTPTSKVYRSLVDADVIIIDEYAFMSCSDLNMVFQRLAQVHRSNRRDGEPVTNFYDNKLLILVGDHAQLPPVCNCLRRADEVTVCKDCHSSSSTVWGKLKKHRLIVSVRHSEDKVLSGFLDLIRSKMPTEDQLRDALGSRMDYKNLEEALEEVTDFNRLTII